MARIWGRYTKYKRMFLAQQAKNERCEIKRKRAIPEFKWDSKSALSFQEQKKRHEKYWRDLLNKEESEEAHRKDRLHFIQRAEESARASGADLLTRSKRGASAARLFDSIYPDSANYEPDLSKLNTDTFDYERLKMEDDAMGKYNPAKSTQVYFDNLMEAYRTVSEEMSSARKYVSDGMALIKKNFDDGIVTQTGADLMKEQLVGKCQADVDRIMGAFDMLVKEYRADVTEWARIDGSKLVMDDVALMNNLSLSAEDVENMILRNQGNYTMIRKIGDYWQQRAREIAKHNEGCLESEKQRAFLKIRLDSPEKKIAAYEKLASELKFMCGTLAKEGFAPEGTAEQLCVSAMRQTMPMVKGEVLDYAKYGGSDKDSGNGVYHAASNGFNFNFTPVRQTVF